MPTRELSVNQAVENMKAELFAPSRPPAARRSDKSSTTTTLDELRKQILASHRKCVQSQAEALSYALEAGEWLLSAKEQVPTGEWLAWLKQNFSAKSGLTARTAQTYMLIAERKEELFDHLDAKRASHLLSQAMATLTIRAAIALLREMDRASGKKSVQQQDKPAISPVEFAVSARDMGWAEELYVGEAKGGQRQVLVQTALDSIEETIDKAVIDVANGRLELAVLLVPLNPTASWFGKIADCPLGLLKKPVLFPKHANDPSAGSALRPAVLVLLGEPACEPQFAKFCRPFGPVLIPYRMPLAVE